MTDRYVVTESTPGYLPDDTDPGTFETLAAARAHARTLVAELREQYGEMGEPTHVRTDSPSSPRSWSVWSSSSDLGRIVEIHDLEPDDTETETQ